MFLRRFAARTSGSSRRPPPPPPQDAPAATAGAPPEPLAPAPRAFSARPQVRNRRGHARESRGARKRQAEKRAVAIELGQRFARQSQPRRSIEAREQCGQGLRRLEDDPRTLVRQAPDVSAELDRIAQPLLPMHQNGLAGKRRLAQPERLCVMPALAARPAVQVLQAPLELTPAVRVIPGG